MQSKPQDTLNIPHIARLARLELEPGEVTALSGQMKAILDYVNLLSKLNLDQVKPMAHVRPSTNVYRDDQVGQTLDKNEILNNAPEVLNNELFKVPVVIENG